MTADPALMTQRYEELRAAALARAPAGHGLALLRHRGMPAWMRAWSQLTPPQTPGSVIPPAAAPSPVAAGAEIVPLLASMALAALGR